MVDWIEFNVGPKIVAASDRPECAETQENWNKIFSSMTANFEVRKQVETSLSATETRGKCDDSGLKNKMLHLGAFSEVGLPVWWTRNLSPKPKPKFFDFLNPIWVRVYGSVNRFTVQWTKFTELCPSLVGIQILFW